MDYKDYSTQQKVETDHFWYIARKNLIRRLLFSACHEKDGNRVILDIGCGTGTELPVLAEFGQVIGLDNNPKALEIAKQQGFNTLIGDLEKEGLGEGRYDIVCAFDVLEHLADDKAAVGKIFKSLKPGGKLVFTSPAFGMIFSQHDRAMGHYRRYEPNKMKELLHEAGFVEEIFGFWNVLLFVPVALMRLVKKPFNRHKEPEQLNTEASNLPRSLNHMLLHILETERHLFGWKRLPFGLTIYGIVKKP